jgi:hypothetical protein
MQARYEESTGSQREIAAENDVGPDPARGSHNMAD